MFFSMRKESLSFIECAPSVHRVEAVIAAPPPAVFAALAEPRGWQHWFPNVREARYTSPPPYGVGTIREADVGGTRWVEEMIAWDADARWAWTVTGASVPFAHAQVESFELSPADGGTRVQWTVALEPRMLARLGGPLMSRTMRRLWLRAAQNLGDRLRRRERDGA